MAKKLKKEILQNLIKKTGNTEGSIRVAISNIRNDNPALTLNAAAQIYAKKQGTSVMQKLDVEDRASLPNLSKIQPAIVSKDQNKKRGNRTKEITIRTSLGVLKDPFLPTVVFQDAQKMSETVYPYLYIFENSLRNFILLIMEKKFGTKWWENQMNTKKLRDIKMTTEDRMTEETKLSFHGKRGAHAIYYTDFSYLIELLKAHKVEFNPFFNNLSGKLDSIIIKLQEIQPSRNVSSHHNPLHKDDLHRLTGHLHDWLKQLDYINTKKML